MAIAMILQMLPATVIGAYADDGDGDGGTGVISSEPVGVPSVQNAEDNYVLTINGKTADSTLRVDYGEPLFFELQGYEGNIAPAFYYATEEDKQDGMWEPIENGSCELEPGVQYCLKYSISDYTTSEVITDDSFFITAQKGTLAAPSGTGWSNGAMQWTAVSESTKEGTLAAGVLGGYEITVYKDGAAVSSLSTSEPIYRNYVNEITTKGAGIYTFAVKALVSEAYSKFYNSSEASAVSGGFVIPSVNLVKGTGIASVNKSDSFIMISEATGYGTVIISAAAAAGYSFAGWSGTDGISGLTLSDNGDGTQTLTIGYDYRGSTELSITAYANDTNAPAISSFTSDSAQLHAAAADNESGIAAYAFSTANDASAVSASEWVAASAAAGETVSADHTVVAGGVYTFYAKDAAGNTAASAVTVEATEIRLHSNDGSGSAEKLFYIGAESVALTGLTRDGWNFAGWYSSPAAEGEEISGIAQHSSASGIDLYAKWTKQTIALPENEDVSREYDGTATVLTAQPQGVSGQLSYQWYLNGSAIEGANESGYIVKNVSDSGVYTCSVTLNYGNGETADAELDEITVSITPAALTVSADDKNISFGAEAPEYTRSVSGLKGGDTESVLTEGTVSCSYAKGGAAGTYIIIISGFSADNYTISFVNGTLTVGEKSENDVQAAFAESFAYAYSEGGSYEPAVTVKDGETVLSENTDYTLSYSGNDCANDSAIARITLKGNYTGTIELPFAIAKGERELSASIDNWVYGDTASQPVLSGDTFGSGYAWVYTDSEGTILSAQPEDAGSYKVYAVVEENGNYVEQTTQAVDFTVEKRTITVTANSAEFIYDGTEHYDNGYTVEGCFVGGQGFKLVLVTGSAVEVTDENGVENTVSYTLTSATDPDNYNIVTVSGRLVVSALALPAPVGLKWDNLSAGTANWIEVTKPNLDADYKVTLYCIDSATGEAQAAGTFESKQNSYNFHDVIAEIIAQNAEENTCVEFAFSVMAYPAGGEGKDCYSDSEMSAPSGSIAGARIAVIPDEHVSGYTVNGTENTEASYIYLISGESIALDYNTEYGYGIGSPVTEGEGISARYNFGTLMIGFSGTQSAVDGKVNLVSRDLDPYIDSFGAYNTEYFDSVDLRFTAGDSVGLYAWIITEEDNVNAAPETALEQGWTLAADGSRSITDGINVSTTGTWHVFVMDTAGNISTMYDENGDIAYASVVEITFNAGAAPAEENEDYSILTAAGTEINLPVSKFSNPNYCFVNWKSGNAYYSDCAVYNPAADAALTAVWTSEYFNYTVEYYYMDTEGNYPEAPAKTADFNIPSGSEISSDAARIQQCATGFSYDSSKTESITVSESGMTLKVFYLRNRYTLSTSCVMPGDTEATESNAEVYYGADISALLTKPQADGYTFVGWSFGDSGAQSETMPAANVSAEGYFTADANVCYLRVFAQELNEDGTASDTYALVDELSRTLNSENGTVVAYTAADVTEITGFSYAGGVASYGSDAGTGLPAEISAEVSGSTDTNGLYINLYYTRNSYNITLNVWQGSIGAAGTTAGLEFAYSDWYVLYGAALPEGITSFGQSEWNEWLDAHEDYLLIDSVGWSTQTEPETMPAGDVVINRQFVLKVIGSYTVEVYLEGETEGRYDMRSFTYYGHVGQNVTVGGDSSFDVNYSTFRNSIILFDYYEEAADGSGDIRTAAVTDTNNGDEPAVLKIYFDRKYIPTTITYYYNQGGCDGASTANVKFAVVTKSMKWGRTHSYNGEALAYFGSS